LTKKTKAPQPVSQCENGEYKQRVRSTIGLETAIICALVVFFCSLMEIRPKL